MNCDCIKRVNEGLAQNLGDPKARILTTFSLEDNSMGSFIPVTAEYRKKKKNGEFTQRTFEIQIRGQYCPFCGEKSEKEKEAK